MLRLFDRLYRWQSADRYKASMRFLAGIGLFVMPAFLSLILLSVAGNDAPDWLKFALWGTFWAFVGALFAWILYSSLRTLRAVWRAIRGKPHELQKWREP